MIGWFFKHGLLLRKAFKSRDTPRQLAYGVACGLVLGIVPKGNFAAVAITVVVFSTRSNLPLATLASVFFSFLGPLIDSLTHLIGWRFLTLELLQPWFLRLEGLPLANWTDFQNTVVTGSLILGLLLFYPTYRLSFWLATRFYSSRGNVPQPRAMSKEVVAAVGTPSLQSLQPCPETHCPSDLLAWGGTAQPTEQPSRAMLGGNRVRQPPCCDLNSRLKTLGPAARRAAKHVSSETERVSISVSSTAKRIVADAAGGSICLEPDQRSG